VSRFLTTNLHSYSIQCHSRWCMLGNTGQKTD